MTQEEGSTISYHSEDIYFELSSSHLTSEWIKQVIQSQNGQLVHLNFVFCSDLFLHDINTQYLNHDTYTDVITFPFSSYPEIEGDIFISIERVKENAQVFDVPFDEELQRIMIHGVLHLCGYQDKSEDDKAKMTQAENAALELLNSIKKQAD